MTIRIPVEQRRARLTRRHHLAAPATPAGPAGIAASGGGLVERVAEDLVALHSTDPATVFLALAARAPVSPTDIERALYEDRTLMRMLGMRRTVFVVPTDLVAVVQESTMAAISARQRRLLLGLLAEAGVAKDPAAWLTEVEDSTIEALAGRGEATAATLSQDEPRLRTQVLVAPDKPYGGQINITSRLLLILAADGRIVRGRPRGSWISTQYTWSPIERWLPGGMPEWSPAAARVELARRWLAAFGPGTVEDIKWWTGWTVADVKRALAALDTVEVDLDGTAGVVLAQDTDPVPAAPPSAALLPALDPTVMGWAGRDWYVGGHRPALFDRTGNAGPTVWWDGRVVGGWAQRDGGEIAVRVLEDVGRDARDAIDAAAAATGAWLGDVRVTPRFRTPLERELSA
ncbi:MAG TPA: winged helix DNA-binding domain-containing protein [Rugosimonospora sp.]